MGTLVVVRVRPSNAQEKGSCLKSTHRTSIECGGNEFFFDRVFPEETTQIQVYEEVNHVVHSVLNGYNGTIMAYGQTSAGKTHTLFGDGDYIHNNHGIVPRAVAELSTTIASSPCQFKVCLSVLEVYNERVRDLLDPSQENLQIFQDQIHGVHVPAAKIVQIHGKGEYAHWVQVGLSNRAIAATSMNVESSRSHCLVIITVEKTLADNTIQTSKLCLVDLAGSERLSRTGAQGTVQQEGQNINKSLLVLGSVVNALNDEKSTYRIPYRDSKLTRLLQDSLGGTARTCVVICVSPSMSNQSETVSSLRFGMRARAIPCKAHPNAAIMTPEMGILAAQKEIKELKEQLAAALMSSSEQCVVNSGDNNGTGCSGVYRRRSVMRCILLGASTLMQIVGMGLYYHYSNSIEHDSCGTSSLHDFIII